MKTMRYLKITCLLFILTVISGCSNSTETSASIEPWYPATNGNGDTIFAVFESRIPCADCNKIKFGLALYWDEETKSATTYMMARVYVANGDDRTVNTGLWTITQGTNLDPGATVYQLDANAPEEFRSFWAIGEDLLFILDQGLNPRVGDGVYSYVLNRMR